MHPCMNCGACCAAYRVAFHWMETIHGPVGPGVPEALTQPLDAHRLVMVGTKSSPVRCVALAGHIGGCTTCRIYDRRPSVCREVMAAGENGLPSDQCDRARAAHGLAPLTRADWQAHEKAAVSRLAQSCRDAPANDTRRCRRRPRPA